MQLFTPDLYRNFALGFAAGTLIMGAVTFDQWSDQVAPPARAGEPMETAQQATAEFLIEQGPAEGQ